jgi:hypothetical protein
MLENQSLRDDVENWNELEQAAWSHAKYLMQVLNTRVVCQ